MNVCVCTVHLLFPQWWIQISKIFRVSFFREIQESELQKFYSRLVKLLQAKELSHETVDSLQRLHLILSATKYTRT